MRKRPLSKKSSRPMRARSSLAPMSSRKKKTRLQLIVNLHTTHCIVLQFISYFHFFVLFCKKSSKVRTKQKKNYSSIFVLIKTKHLDKRIIQINKKHNLCNKNIRANICSLGFIFGF